MRNMLGSFAKYIGLSFTLCNNETENNKNTGKYDTYKQIILKKMIIFDQKNRISSWPVLSVIGRRKSNRICMYVWLRTS